MTKLQDGRIPVLANDFPTFLYPEGAYNPDDIEHGLCQGPLLVRVRHQIHYSSIVLMHHPVGLEAYIHVSNFGNCDRPRSCKDEERSSTTQWPRVCHP